jgi:hypothetical protein
MSPISLKYFFTSIVPLFCICGIAASVAAKMMPQYNHLTFIRFMAKVESVNTLKNPAIGRMGLHLIAKDSLNNLYLVHICPQWYADKHPEQFSFKKGDLLIISGSRFATNLTPNNIFAATIINCSQNHQTLNVRDPLTGNALWNNQPDDLLDKIQKVQQQVFLGNSKFIQENIRRNISRFQTKKTRLLMTGR